MWTNASRKASNGIPQSWEQRTATLLRLEAAIVMSWQQMGGLWSWLWATGGHKRANWKGITHTDSHTLVVAFTCALARTGGSTQMQDTHTHTQYHTLNYSDSHVNTLQQCVTHRHSGAPLCPQRKAPRGERKGVRVLFLTRSM